MRRYIFCPGTQNQYGPDRRRNALQEEVGDKDQDDDGGGDPADKEVDGGENAGGKPQLSAAGEFVTHLLLFHLPAHEKGEQQAAECHQEVVKRSDFTGSTSQIMDYVKKSNNNN